ncbi:phage tail terminator protein [Pseudohongiella nitratireducens]|uniref:phage tail terminator protein n=1 Tax=Pseudohongiella nitratireducens TaxID=1768907 RepID=UPI0030EE3FCC|tara:strand:+ start:1935 stop:2324 length:390 start_codon:yes stop_codon:yes gene_type:complete
MIDSLITYLQANTENFTTIDHAWTTEPVDEVRGLAPALWLFPDEEDTEADGTDYLVSNMLHKDVGIYIVCDISELEARKAELRTAAIGWRAGPSYHDLHLVRGKMLSIKGSLAWWHETYRNAVVLREAY